MKTRPILLSGPVVNGRQPNPLCNFLARMGCWWFEHEQHPQDFAPPEETTCMHLTVHKATKDQLRKTRMNKTKSLLSILLLGVAPLAQAEQGLSGSSDIQVLNQRVSAATLGYNHLKERVQSLEAQINHLNRGGPKAGGSQVATSELNAIKARLSYLEGGNVRIPERLPQVGGGEVAQLLGRISQLETKIQQGGGVDQTFVVRTERNLLRLSEQILSHIKTNEERHLGYVRALTKNEGEPSESKLARRVALLESQVSILENYRTEMQGLEMELRGKISDQDAQLAQILKLLNREYAGGGSPASGRNPATARVDSSAFLRTARAAATADEIPQVNCLALGRNRESDWSVAVLHALPTQRFMKLDKDGELVITTNTSGNPVAHRMDEIRKMAGCN